MIKPGICYFVILAELLLCLAPVSYAMDNGRVYLHTGKLGHSEDFAACLSERDTI